MGQLVPNKLRDKWDFQTEILDPETQQPTGETELLHPTWSQAAERLKSQYGQAIDFEYNEAKYKLLEMQLSFVKSEMTAVISLQTEASIGYYILSNEEAKALLRGEGDSIFQ